MSITRAQAEAMIVGRVASWLAKAKLSTAVDGTNPDMNDPMRRALAALGLGVSDPAAVADADFAALTDEDLDEFLDRAELAAMKRVRGNFTKTSVMVTGAVQTYTSDLLRQLAAIIPQMEADIQRDWGSAFGSLSVHMLDNATAETLDGPAE